jgi:PASTA domain
MQDRTAAAPTQVGDGAAKPRRGRPSSRQIVGEYVGQRAAEAAQAVRCAGLKPGLDRSFGGSAELFGQVVAQEPPVGGELARNGLVTLYVAAPGAGQAGEDAAAQPMASRSPTETPPMLAPEPTEPASPRATGPRLRRKTGRARRAAPLFDVPPAATPQAEDERGEPPQPTEEEAQERERPTECVPSRALAPESPQEQSTEELTAEEFVVQADDVFAGRARGALPAWRRVYPRRSSSRLRSRLAEHPWLVRTALALLALWLVVGVASALTAHRASDHGASPVQPSAKTPRSPAGAVRAAAVPEPRISPPPRRRSTRAKAPIRHRRATRRRRAPTVAVAPAGVRPVRVSGAAPGRAAPAPVSTAPARAQEPSEGGLFSP